MLNDQVEEMKWQRRQQQQRQQLLSSTCATPSIDDTDCSDTERRSWSRSVAPDTPDSWSLLPRPSRDDNDELDEEAPLKYPTPSALSLLRGGATHDDRFSDSGSVDAMDRPDTPEVFPATPQTTAGPRTSPPKKLTTRTLGDGEETKEQHSSTADTDNKLPRSPTKMKEQERRVLSTNSDSFKDFYTYVEMLI